MILSWESKYKKCSPILFFANKTTIFRPILTYTPHFHPLSSNQRRVDKVMPHIKALRVNPPLIFPSIGAKSTCNEVWCREAYGNTPTGQWKHVAVIRAYSIHLYKSRRNLIYNHLITSNINRASGYSLNNLTLARSDYVGIAVPPHHPQPWSGCRFSKLRQFAS